MYTEFLSKLRIPVMGAPMHIASSMELVKAQCKSGIVGCFPSQNPRSKQELEVWINSISKELSAYSEKYSDKKVAPFGINQIIHPEYKEQNEFFKIYRKYKVPLIITSLNEPSKTMVEDIKEYGGLIFHDVTKIRYAEKAIEAGVDGIILISAGSGGHCGQISPFSFIKEVRNMFNGIIVVAGGITNGEQILASNILGADMCYIGTRFIASKEAFADQKHKQMIVDSSIDDIVVTDKFTGYNANFMKKSLENCGIEIESLQKSEYIRVNFNKSGINGKKVWKDIWSAGHSVAGINEIMTVSEIVAKMEQEYKNALLKTKDLV